ncbi:hypothetical protein V6M93_10235 [Pectobacterium brasiliense]|uniref:hypothetical protein n=1 Tax=Pectobacterium TaxID=122277 RepID=UPI001F0AE0E5|nr:hypothetical protein [Pectobacterium brasiliense]
MLYTTHSQIRIDYEEDFAVPVSLQRYLERKSAESSMLVVDMTSEFRKQYPNTDNYTPISKKNLEMIVNRGVSEIASGVGRMSPYSGGTIDGLLGGMHDVNK